MDLVNKESEEQFVPRLLEMLFAFGVLESWRFVKRTKRSDERNLEGRKMDLLFLFEQPQNKA